MGSKRILQAPSENRTRVEFARRVGYRKMMLWTNGILDSARRICERKGFRLVKEERHHSFGKNLVGQNWELDLRS